LEDEYLQQRAVDVRSVGDQVLVELVGKEAQKPLKLTEPIVLFAEDLTPFETSQLDLEKVLGIVTVLGGPTSHSAILSRALGIPALAGVDPGLQGTKEGANVIVDGIKGIFWVDPSVETVEQYQSQRDAWLKERQELLLVSARPAKMLDGKRVEVVANIGSAADARSAMKNGAEGVGLLRTEFQFLSRDSAPNEEEQYRQLCDIGAEMGQRPIIVRTLDIGGDKEVPYLNLPKEANPFLGLRATRMLLKDKDLFQAQLKAILRASALYQYRIMFPMIASLWELEAAKVELENAHQELLRMNVSHRWPVEVGIMVEIPSAAVISGVFAKHVDFFSIGTNDLTQYTLAAERGNPNLSEYADGLHPAVINLIGEVCENAHQAGKWVGVCGELAGDQAAIPVLIGLGVDELSMNPGSIPKAKAWIRNLSASKTKELAKMVRSAQDTKQARQLAVQFGSEISFSI
jgi:phosphoenolpyruvate-protein phosphotransferase